MPRHNAAEAMPPVPEAKGPNPGKKKKHLKLVEDAGEIELKDADLEEIEDMTDEAVHEPTLAEEAAARMAKEKAETGAAVAQGREAQAIREAQAQLAHAAVEELAAEQEAEEKEPFGKELTMKPLAKPASVFDRIKSWFGKK